MRLADFIRANREPILAEWEAFARTCMPAGGTMDIEALRDHADAMLTVIAADVSTPQTRGAQATTSKRHARAAPPAVPTAAAAHGAERAESGFTMEQMVAEYRALRTSVIRLWVAAQGALEPADVEDLTRFNEAIDRSLAEAVSRFSQDVEQAKEIFLAILGHDLRMPLGAIYTSATFMLETDELEEPHRTLTARIASSAKRSVAMVGDLLDFTRGRLAGGIPVVRTETNLSKIVHDVADELTAAHPGRRIRVETSGEQRGRWDAARLTQALGNLIGNALQHSAAGTTVTVKVRDEPEQVAIAVHNRGAVIPPDQLNGIFNPMKVKPSSPKASTKGPTGGLGLGLYIAERIVSAHGGHIEVESSEEHGTTFTVYLPRQEKATATG